VALNVPVEEPSTASLADIEILGAHVRLTPKSRHTHVKTDVR
jgi:hypothetical protein